MNKINHQISLSDLWSKVILLGSELRKIKNDFLLYFIPVDRHFEGSDINFTADGQVNHPCSFTKNKLLLQIRSTGP